MTLSGEYFCGNKISEYGIKNGFLDYGTLSKAFDAVLNNSIYNAVENMGFFWDQESGTIDNFEDLEDEQERTPDIFQYYIVDNSGAELLEELNEIVFYCSDLDMYLWGVTHFGTAWDYVLTDVPCNCEKEA